MPGRTQVINEEGDQFRLQGPYLLWPAVPSCSTIDHFCNSSTVLRNNHMTPTTPNELSPQAVTLTWFRLFPVRSPLLRESRFLSFLLATEMCHFASLPSPVLCVQTGIRTHYSAWVSPFGDPRFKGCSAPHRGLSQPSTSFIGYSCQGIHRVPLLS